MTSQPRSTAMEPNKQTHNPSYRFRASPLESPLEVTTWLWDRVSTKVKDESVKWYFGIMSQKVSFWSALQLSQARCEPREPRALFQNFENFSNFSMWLVLECFWTFNIFSVVGARQARATSRLRISGISRSSRVSRMSTIGLLSLHTYLNANIHFVLVSACR